MLVCKWKHLSTDYIPFQSFYVPLLTKVFCSAVSSGITAMNSVFSSVPAGITPIGSPRLSSALGSVERATYTWERREMGVERERKEDASRRRIKMFLLVCGWELLRVYTHLHVYMYILSHLFHLHRLLGQILLKFSYVLHAHILYMWVVQVKFKY